MVEQFKNTEIGLIPNDWEVEEIQNVVEITTGAKNTQDRIPDGQYPFFVRSQTVERINSFSYDGEAVLTAGDGVGTGKVFHYVNDKFDFHQRVYKMSGFSKERLDGYYFYLYFSQNFYNRIMQMTAKSSVDSVRKEMIAKMLIPLPTKAEQTAIATALNDANALIKKLEQLIAKKQTIKTGAMRELLKPKEGWEEKTLYELAENKKELFDDGDWIEAKHITHAGVRLIQTGNIGVGCFLEKENKKYILEDSFYRLKCKKLIEGDLLICRLAEPAGRACVLPNIGESRIVTSVDVTIFRPRPEIVNRVFLVHIFSTSEWFTKVIEKVGGTTHKRISRSGLGKILISLPKIEEQSRIAQILSDMDYEIHELEHQLGKYKMIKHGMMQSLLTGKIRLV